jgi:site-specific DNA recombinase
VNGINQRGTSVQRNGTHNQPNLASRPGTNSRSENGSAKVVRCAIYTRKSTEEGLNQEFNTLDAQRASAESFIASQKNEGWVCLPERYDDGGFTGGNIDRPALKRLMDAIEAGGVDCVVVYKVDRLSRSLMDFARLMELFDRKGVSFVSVTQQFNTTHSMGRLTLNILLSFAQFEREIISERTRDKIAAARRKGKYALGKPILGYDFVPTPPPFSGRRLLPNEAEAARVREMFRLYLETKSLLQVAEECNARGWRTKAWTTTAGRAVGGRPFDKAILSKLLRNALYLGKVPHHKDWFDGEHAAIVDPDVFRRVQAQLVLGAQQGGAFVRNGGVGGGTGGGSAALRGLVRCGACGSAMTPTHTTKHATPGNPGAPNGGKGGAGKVYRYYVCSKAAKRGRDACPTPNLPAEDLEGFVLEQVKANLLDGPTTRAIVDRAIEMMQSAATARREERDELTAQIAAIRTTNSPTDPAVTARALHRLERQITALDAQIRLDDERLLDEDELTGAVESLDGVWAALTPSERQTVMRSLVSCVEYNAESQSVTVTFAEGVGLQESTELGEVAA